MQPFVSVSQARQNVSYLRRTSWARTLCAIEAQSHEKAKQQIVSVHLMQAYSVHNFCKSSNWPPSHKTLSQDLSVPDRNAWLDRTNFQLQLFHEKSYIYYTVCLLL